MHIQDTYKTITKPSEGFFKDRGSKFYAFAFPVNDETEVNEHRAALRKKYHDARHHVYAFHLGIKQPIYRSSDDGEPANSSGPPILGQIRAFGLTNILIVVIRYFGGTKLGIPGLINAYKTAAADALNNAFIIEKTLSQKLSFTFDYPVMNDIMRMTKDEDIKIKKQEFLASCFLEIDVKISKLDVVKEKLKQIKSVQIKD
ncbi:MAG: YigZ family protein [Bacteroidales bacterium]|nr:YigZ family protein [Bacteroidales bacterium]